MDVFLYTEHRIPESQTKQQSSKAAKQQNSKTTKPFLWPEKMRLDEKRHHDKSGRWSGKEDVYLVEVLSIIFLWLAFSNPCCTWKEHTKLSTDSKQHKEWIDVNSCSSTTSYKCFWPTCEVYNVFWVPHSGFLTETRQVGGDSSDEGLFWQAKMRTNIL